MATTTIRVDLATRATLLELAAETGATLIDTTRAAADALRRQRFAAHVSDEISVLHSDPVAWADYSPTPGRRRSAMVSPAEIWLVDFGDPYAGESAHRRPASS